MSVWKWSSIEPFDGQKRERIRFAWLPIIVKSYNWTRDKNNNSIRENVLQIFWGRYLEHSHWYPDKQKWVIDRREAVEEAALRKLNGGKVSL